MFQFTAEQVGKLSGIGFLEVLARRYIVERVFLSAAILAIAAVVSLAQQASEYGSVPWVGQSGIEPAIVQHGWTSPDTIYLRRNIAELEKRPFTGTVTWISWPRQENGIRDARHWKSHPNVKYFK